MKADPIIAQHWYNHSPQALGLAVLGVGLAYLLASRAIDTGSLQQYFLTIVLLVFAGNRFIHIFYNPERHGKK